MNTPFRICVFNILITLCSLAWASLAHAQTPRVAITGYTNQSSSCDEYVQLLVMEDDVDMRKWSIRDNEANQDNWESPITFRNIDYWKHMRKGTIIVLWNRCRNSSGTSRSIDTSKTDGRIYLCLDNTSYFSGGSGFWNCWDDDMNIGNGGDLVQLRDSNQTHVHAMGHKGSTGSDWNSLPAPKLNLAGSLSSGEMVRACSAGSVFSFNGSSGQLVVDASTNFNTGRANKCSGTTDSAKLLVKLLREPVFASDTICVQSDTGTWVFLSFQGAVDPVPTDETQGYLVLKSASNSFNIPSDGKKYSTGDTVGANKVVGNFDNKGNAITESIYCNPGTGTWFFRIFAYRYDSSYTAGDEVGRQYQTGTYVEAFPNSNASNAQPDSFLLSGCGDTVKVRIKPASISNPPSGYLLARFSTNRSVTPSNAKLYSTGDSIGSGRVIFCDSISAGTAKLLVDTTRSCTTYYYKIWSFAGWGACRAYGGSFSLDSAKKQISFQWLSKDTLCRGDSTRIKVAVTGCSSAGNLVNIKVNGTHTYPFTLSNGQHWISFLYDNVTGTYPLSVSSGNGCTPLVTGSSWISIHEADPDFDVYHY